MGNDPRRAVRVELKKKKVRRTGWAIGCHENKLLTTLVQVHASLPAAVFLPRLMYACSVIFTTACVHLIKDQKMVLLYKNISYMKHLDIMWTHTTFDRHVLMRIQQPAASPP